MSDELRREPQPESEASDSMTLIEEGGSWTERHLLFRISMLSFQNRISLRMFGDRSILLSQVDAAAIAI